MSDDNAGPAPKMARIEEETAQWMENTIRFNDPDPNTHDVVIHVKGEKFYCVKMTLAKHSSYFYNKFFKDPKLIGKKEVTLKEPATADDFNTFLQILHGVNSLNDECIRGILKLSKTWNCSVAYHHCLDFLEESCKLPVKEKFDITVEFELLDQKKKIIAECSSSDDLHKLMPKQLTDLDHETMGLIFERNLALQGFPGRYEPFRHRSVSPAPQWVLEDRRDRLINVRRRIRSSSSSSSSSPETIDTPSTSDDED